MWNLLGGLYNARTYILSVRTAVADETLLQKEKVWIIMAVADELEAVIDTLPETYQEAARELVAEIQARPEDDQLRALKELIADKVRALEPEDEEGDDE